MLTMRRRGEAMNNGQQTRAEATCRELVELLTDFLEGSCDAATARALQAHLAECPDCREYVAQMKATIELVGHVPLESLSAETRENLVAAFRNYPRATHPN
jgi:anti-sigma factor RsiW